MISAPSSYHKLAMLSRAIAVSHVRTEKTDSTHVLQPHFLHRLKNCKSEPLLPQRQCRKESLKIGEVLDFHATALPLYDFGHFFAVEAFDQRRRQ